MSEYLYNSPNGTMLAKIEDNCLTKLIFLDDLSSRQLPPLPQPYKKQLDEYCNGKRKYFDLPINPQGTDFQKSVWSVLKTIPYGETITYKEIAEKIGNEKASRAVGAAIGKNPLHIIIPCHRVIGSNGTLIGYAGGLIKKKWLLYIEACHNFD